MMKPTQHKPTGHSYLAWLMTELNYYNVFLADVLDHGTEESLWFMQQSEVNTTGTPLAQLAQPEAANAQL